MPDRVRLRGTLLLSLLGLGLLFKGGVHPRHFAWVLLGIVALSAWSLRVEGPLGRPSRGTKGLLFILGLGVLLQILPLPSGIRTSLSPGTQILLEQMAPIDVAPDNAFWERLVLHDFEVSLGETPSELTFTESLAANKPADALPISLDAPRTRWVLATWLGALAVFFLSCRLTVAGQGALLLKGFFLICVLEAIWGLINMQEGSLGLFPKEHYLGSATGTFVNRNHFASLLLLGLGAGGALWWRETAKTPAVRLLYGVGLGLCAAGLVASQSRAGVFLGIAWSAWALFHAPPGKSFLRSRAVLFAGLALAASLLAMEVGLFDRMDGGLATDASLQGRLDIWSHGIEQWRGFLFSGCGLGGFTWVASLGHDAPYLFHFDHLHNDYLQLLVEGGLLIGAPVLIFLATGVSRANRLFRSGGSAPSQAALLGALLAVLLHAFVDFPFQIPGLLLSMALLSGQLWGQVKPAETPSSKSSRIAPLLLVALALVSLQAAKRDAIQADNIRLLEADMPALSSIEAQLLREKPGAREGLGRLALLRAEAEASPTNPVRSLTVFVEAAEASRRRLQEQSLDGNAHASEAMAWARAANFARGASSESPLSAEEMTQRAESALARALLLQAENPRLLFQFAKAQLYLSRGGAITRSHTHRASRALAEAVLQDPWMASRAYRLATELSDSELEHIGHDHHLVRYEEGLAWQRRGRLERAERSMEASIELNARFGPVHFSLGELRRGQGDTTASNAHYLRYLQLGKLQTGMGAWSTYWTGDPEKALVLFEDLLRNSPQNEWLQRGLLSARSAIEEN